ncbi:hypothetical protein FBUS_06390 [Fasciolopsis buskii]|uniref:Uncharacterized protein n=1 Tax=Fasciolopsis buskii TaxID=27845 RepID=A0A8E0RP68_9TREM|nr:hypothetical protein FBUS_06390 [Fasciolopsis buski]
MNFTSHRPRCYVFLQGTARLPTLDEVIQMTNDRVKAVPAIKSPADIAHSVREATQSVQTANATLGLLETATKNHIEALRDAIRNGDAEKLREKKWDHVSRLAARKDKAQEQANAAVNEAS